jgi:hypothetical protein
MNELKIGRMWIRVGYRTASNARNTNIGAAKNKKNKPFRMRSLRIVDVGAFRLPLLLLLFMPHYHQSIALSICDG